MAASVGRPRGEPLAHEASATGSAMWRGWKPAFDAHCLRGVRWRLAYGLFSGRSASLSTSSRASLPRTSESEGSSEGNPLGLRYFAMSSGWPTPLLLISTACLSQRSRVGDSRCAGLSSARSCACTLVREESLSGSSKAASLAAFWSATFCCAATRAKSVWVGWEMRVGRMTPPARPLSIAARKDGSERPSPCNELWRRSSTCKTSNYATRTGRSPPVVPNLGAAPQTALLARFTWRNRRSRARCSLLVAAAQPPNASHHLPTNAQNIHLTPTTPHLRPTTRAAQPTNVHDLPVRRTPPWPNRHDLRRRHRPSHGPHLFSRRGHLRPL